ncbi:MAG: hypothetical protein U5N10_11160 [Gemmobacter sp.]|nr:hypothetical protein [Gemmobacter sp.]
MRRLGEGLGFRQEGVMYLAKTDKEMAGFEDWLAMAAPRLLATRSAGRRRGLMGRPSPAAKSPGSVRCSRPSDAQGRTLGGGARMMARLAAGRGARVIEELRRAGARTAQAGRVMGVVTEQGRIACRCRWCWRGAWSVTVPAPARHRSFRNFRSGCYGIGDRAHAAGGGDGGGG